MQNIRRKKSTKRFSRFKKRHPKIFVFFNHLDRTIKRIGEFLIIFNLDGIRHIVDQDRHIIERQVF